MDVDALMQVYPNLDRMMAETLLTLSKQGKLESYLKDLTDKHPPPASSVLPNAISVTHPEEKSSD